MKPKTILTAGPSTTSREVDYVLDAVQHGWNENWSGYLERFEQAFAAYVVTGVLPGCASLGCAEPIVIAAGCPSIEYRTGSCVTTGAP